MADPGILIVEADILVRHPLAEYLRECGFTVYEAADGGEARHFIEEPPGPIDFVLADAAAPQVGGFSLAAWIRNAHPRIDVLLAGTIARAAEIAGTLCEDEGPALRKPYDHSQVLDLIRQRMAARDRNTERD